MRVIAFLFALLLAALGAEAAPSVHAGANTSFAVRADGTVRSWGSDDSGKLGTGRQLFFGTPTLVRDVTDVVQISAGWAHVLALKSDGTVWAWGDNLWGELGDGTTKARSTAEPVHGLQNVVAVSAGYLHSVALTADGRVWTWGANNTGQLGNTDCGCYRLLPAPVTALSGVAAISAGFGYTLALRNDGTVWAWGRNDYGQLGDGSNVTREQPAPVSGLGGVMAIAGGLLHSAAIKSDGSVWTWGNNEDGQLGDGTTTDRRLPVRVNIAGVAAIALGATHMLALRTDGTVWAWGDNSASQLGDGTDTTRLAPVQVQGISGVTGIAAGLGHSVALRSDGSVWTWGDNTFCEMTDCGTGDRALPGRIGSLAGIIAIYAGGFQTYALRSDRRALSWGDNSSGQLGNGDARTSSAPAVVASLSNVTMVAAGERHTLALKGDGTVWGWGDNVLGELGDGGHISRSTPSRIEILGSVTAIAAGFGHAAALTASGRVWTWGNNANGELGNGTSDYSDDNSRPQLVAGLTDVVAISSGPYHMAALKSDGTVWTWGSNAFGQLGDGTTTDRPTAIRVLGLNGIISISASFSGTLALKNDGTVWFWGDNTYGQAGDGTGITTRPFAVQVAGLSDIVSISAGYVHGVALKRDGTVWTWGRNQWGQLGDGTLIDRRTPAPVPGLDHVTSISAGGAHTLALQASGLVLSWGWSDSSQLGDGAFAIRNRPVVVLREGGAGSIAGNNWFLDLNPAIAKTIPPERIPTFLVLASGDFKSAIVANVQFRSQDVGKPIYIFAYAPSALVKSESKGNAKGPSSNDGTPCVLSQLTSTGALAATSASSMQAYTSNVTSSQGQSVTMLNNVAPSQVAGATFCVGTAASADQSVAASNSQCVVTAPSDQTVCVPPAAASGPPANNPGALSGLWWNQNESGWGIHFTQRRDIIFAAWYTYDGSGNPKWYVASNCTMPAANATSGTCNGALYEVDGPTFFGTPFNSSLVHVTQAGSLSVNFANADNATMTYTVGANTRTVPITRQPITSGTTPPAVNYTDLWWNSSESGWGIAIAQQYGIMFLAWYVYDGAGKPMWYVASNCTVSGSGCSGTLYRTTGPPFGPTFNPALIQVFTAGTVTLNFSDANNGTLSYTVNGVSASKTITRQLF